MQKNLQKELVERALITTFMPKEKYWELRKKYGHAEVVKAMNGAMKALQAPLLVRISRRIRWRLERFLAWGERLGYGPKS